MNDHDIPDPPEPNYPPRYASWGPEPTNIHVTVSPEKVEEPAWDWRWLQLGINAGTAALAYLPAIVWAKVLNDVLAQQGLNGAWTMGAAGVLVTAIRFGQRRTWTRRTMVWIAVLGCVFALPVFNAMVNVLTGSGR